MNDQDERLVKIGAVKEEVKKVLMMSLGEVRWGQWEKYYPVLEAAIDALSPVGQEPEPITGYVIQEHWDSWRKGESLFVAVYPDNQFPDRMKEVTLCLVTPQAKPETDTPEGK